MPELIKNNIDVNIPQNTRQKNLPVVTEAKNIIENFENKYPDLPEKLKDLKVYHEKSYNHLKDTANLAFAVADHLNLPDEKRDLITLSAHFHDIGKVNTDIDILNKTSSLTEFEYEQIKKHVINGYNIVSKYDKDIANIIYYHHKFKKLFPYPEDAEIHPDERIKRNISESENYEKEIKKLGKILAIIDIFHAITSNREYSKGKEELKNMTPEKCKDVIVKELNLDNEDEKIIDYLNELKKSTFIKSNA